MSMKFLLSILSLFILQLFSAQEEIYANGIFGFEENKTQKIFTDWTRVRLEPDVNAEILDSLSTNQQVTILKKEDKILQLGERASNWYKVSYQKGDKISEGYLWGGNLCVGYRNKNGYDFLFGLSKTETRKDKQSGQSFRQNIASIKVLQENTLIDEVFFDTGSGESLSYATFNMESNHQLKDVELTLKAMVSGEACGIASYDQYALFSNKKLIALPQLMNVGDADVYYHSENFIFPNDKGGVPNAFVWEMEEMEKDDNDKEKIKRSSIIYLWNGAYFRKK
ncbi:SH3 domain-containing protein [Chryseobacterium defluvii]|uniref:SH3 domain-containing protein n=1 Tax=Chryseobacterium defluvii TaxID=160396 RepID=A0A495SC48_9FLAO|nr:SH3 domain-containing protein [Chryseobacterium defluvii]RKS97436.1 SH3 domain-containing protein [Chryseobacterium defluvii]